MKRLLFGIVALLVLLVAAIFIVPSFINWNTYKPEIVAAVRDATGRELDIGGDIHLKLLPAPALSVEDVRLANIEGAPTPEMATLSALDVRVALFPLLGGEIQVESVKLVEPTIVLERLADGRANWVLTGTDSGEPASDGGGDGGGRQPALRLDLVEVENGTVIYRDVAAGSELRVEALSLIGSAATAVGPFEAKGEARVADLPMTFEARAGALGGDRPVPVLLLLGLQGEDGGLTLSGNVVGQGADATFEGTVKASSGNPATLMDRIGVVAALPKPMQGKLEVDGKVEASATQVAANDLTVRLGESQATGAVSVALETVPSIDATLALNRIDLDAILAAADPATTGGGGLTGGGGADTAAAYPSLPTDLNASLNLSVDGIAYRQGVLRQARLSASLEDGELRIDQLGALLPGGSDLKLSGTLREAEGLPRFEGQVETTSDNLRGLLAWLQVDAEQVPAGRLGNMALTAELRASPKLVEVYGMNLRLDASTITGGIAFLIQDRPSFGIDLVIDRLNLDGYLPTAAAAKGGGQGGGSDGGGAPESPLTALDGFDTNTKIQVGRLTYNNTPVDGLDADLTLVGGQLTVRKATVTNIAGASASLAATATEIGKGNPRIDGSLRVLANDLTGLARLARLELPVPAARLGAADITTALTGTAGKLDIDARATIGQIAATAKGTVTDALTQPRGDLKLSFDHPSLAALSKLLDLGVTPVQGHDGAVALAADVRGGAQEVNVDGTVKAAGATLTAAGRFAELQATPKLDVAVNLVHADLRKFMRGLGVVYDPALQQLGGLGVSARLNGSTEAMDIRELKGVIGPVQVAGTGTLALGGARPYVRADLQTNEVIADFFLAPAGGGNRAGGGQGQRQAAVPAAGRWSREPLDLSGLGAVDADLTLRSKQISFDRYDFVDAALDMELRDGVLKFKPLTGTLFGGPAKVTMVLGSRPRPSLDLKVNLQDADIRQALVTAANYDKISGRLNLNGQFQTSGASPWALVSGLQGRAKVTGGDGAVEGIDMALLSARLGRLNKLPDFLDLMNRAFAGGSTRLLNIDGDWEIRDGVARTQNTVARLEASVANVVGAVSLPAWEMDIKSTLTLTEHQDAPPVGIELTGPLDNPRRDVKTAALEQFVATRVGSTLLRKSLGDDKDKGLERLLDKTLGKPKTDNGNGGGNNSQRDAVKGLLKGILKGQ